MRSGLKLSLLIMLLSICLAGNAQAKLKGYTYPYDISQIEWQILNWTAAYRNTTTPADPFILERMEYNRKENKVVAYLTGKPEIATEENLNKSIDGINKMFKQRFTNFEISTDAVVYYKLKADNDQGVSYKEYRDGVFSDRQFPPEEPKMEQPGMMAPPATGY